LDYAFVALAPNYRRLLEANGIVAVTEDDWRQDGVEFDEHFMIGLPEDTIGRRLTSDSGGYTFRAEAPPSAIYVAKLDQPPDGLRPTKYPRFVGKLPDEHDIGDIAGMSGGLIFAFAKGREDKYWIIAIQSSWLPNSKMIFGCPLFVCVKHFKEQLDAAAR
jgi:hypothetical protein